MTYLMKCKTAFKNNKEEPEPFYIHLSGGVVVRKIYLVNVITEYVKRNLKYHGQKIEQPSTVVTSFTGKAVSHINRLTLHSASHLQINRNNKIHVKFRLPCKKVLQKLWNKYRYLKIIIFHETLMTEERTFNGFLKS